MTFDDVDFGHLIRCVDLAEKALETGNAPFGSVLVGEGGDVLFEARNQIGLGDHTLHPEFEIARWAARNMSQAERERATVYTSGEHCPMCAAAHGFTGLGRIVYASSSEQLSQWRKEFGVQPGAVAALPISSVLPNAHVRGPEPRLEERVKNLQSAYAKR